jgi:hypothetical protein
MSWGRFTLKGSPTLEKKIVEKREGVESLHNNLDFLLISPPRSTLLAETCKQKLLEVWHPLQERYGIAFDLSILSLQHIRRSAGLVLWYDLYHAHKILLGDPQLFSSLTLLNRIDPADVRNLLVNRGTLLLINELLSHRGNLELSERKLQIRHFMKAVIGYGDALLFSRGAYHASYQAKQKALRLLETPYPAFQKLYDQALDFRFAPDYTPYLQQEGHVLQEWMESWNTTFSQIHLETESLRLGSVATHWNEYPSLAWSHYLWKHHPYSWRRWARKFQALLHFSTPPLSLSFQARLGFRCSLPRERLFFSFPFVAYPRAQSPENTALLHALFSLKTTMTTPLFLKQRYLQEWRQYGDNNSANLFRQLKILQDPS